MNIFSKLFPSKNLKKLRVLLDKLEVELDNPAFKIVREKVERSATKSSEGLNKVMNSDIDHEVWIIGHISNISGDLVESGEYHMYRGVLNPIGHGENLLRLFYQCIDLYQEKGIIDKEYANEQKKQVRLNMQDVG